MTLFPGKYLAKLYDVAFDYTKSGKERVNVLFEIADGDQTGQVVRWQGYFTDKTRKRTLESLRYCGWTGDDLSDVLNQDLSELVEIEVSNEEGDNGKTYARVDWVNKPGGGQKVAYGKAMSKDDLVAFAARLRSSAAAVDSGKPEGDDIPF